MGAGAAALGIDVGSTTAKVAVVDGQGAVLETACARHHGHPRRVVQDLVLDVERRSPGLRRGCTGTIGVALAAELSAAPVHEVQAMVAPVRALHPEVRTIVELGGQDAKLVIFGDTAAGDDAQMNDRCAAGTGATLDRVARRLGLSASDLAALALSGDADDARVAAKCGVFAERDVVDLVKRGVGVAQAFSGLLRAICVQTLAVLARGRVPRGPVVLLGGPHAHVPALKAAWREALAALWSSRGLAIGDVLVPASADRYAAIGAALHALRGASSRVAPGRPHATRTPEPALGVDAETRRALACAPPPRDLPPGRLRVLVGIDAGSTTAKVALLSPDGALLAGAYGLASGNPVDDVRARLAELEARAARVGASLDVASVGVTGYGAPLVAAALGADATEPETLAHVRSALRVAPGTDVVVDVGGTDVKVLRLAGGAVADFHVSNQCAAGLGAFLHAVATDLGVPIDDVAERALSARRAPRFAVGCAVFADTDRVTFQRDGYTPDELLAGLARALPRNVWEFVVAVPVAQLGRSFLLAGGVHRNLAVAAAQADYLREHVPGARVSVHPYPELAGAIGAALAGAEATGSAGVTAFRGTRAAGQLRVAVRAGAATRCGRCEMACERSVVTFSPPSGAPVELVTGNACERGADAGAGASRSRAHAPDLFADEAERLFAPVLPTPVITRRRDEHVIGIPRVMGLYRCAPLILHYLRALGVPDSHVVLSPPTSHALFQEGALRGANDPCFPAKLVLAHVDWLLRARDGRRIDVLFLPTITHAMIAPRGTTDTASCPIVAACGHTTLAALARDGDALGRPGITPLVPTLCLASLPRLGAQLFAAFAPLLEVSLAEHERALSHALAAQAAFLSRGRQRAQRVLARARRDGRGVAVLLARPYHADPGVQHGVSVELAARGIPVLSIASLPVDDEARLSLADVLPRATNSGDAEKLWAARLLASEPYRHVYPVDLSSFKCGQDAAMLGVLGDELAALGRPVLRLHDLDEDRPIASLRVPIETFLASVRRHERRARPRGDATLATGRAP